MQFSDIPGKIIEITQSEPLAGFLQGLVRFERLENADVKTTGQWVALVWGYRSSTVEDATGGELSTSSVLIEFTLHGRDPKYMHQVFDAMLDALHMNDVAYSLGSFTSFYDDNLKRYLFRWVAPFRIN